MHGYIAIPEIAAADFVLVNYELERTDKKYIRWWIVEKSFWEQNHYIDDVVLDFEIPDFGEDMECCYSYQPSWPNDDMEMQSNLLKGMGFEIVNHQF